MALYVDLIACCGKIDRRSTRYQFDLERDVAWGRIGEPGIYFTPRMLAEYGVDPAVLAGEPAAAELFQWALALATCRTFEDLEENIVRGIAESGELTGCRSADLLSEEERKHIALFRRYGEHLRTRHVELLARFDQLYARCSYIHSVGRPVDLPADAAFLREGHAPIAFPTDAVEHFLFWLDALFFEEFTVYLHERLVDDPAVQPAWLSAHAAHRREEVQHIVTDCQLMRALDLTDAQRRQYSILHVYHLAKTFRYFTGLDTPCQLVREQFPHLPPFDRDPPFLRSPFVEAIRQSRAFCHTRALPGFAELP